MPFQGTTVRIKNTLTDYDGSPLTPDSQEVRIYDTDGIEVDYGDTNEYFTPDLESEGVYFIDYIIPADGKVGKWKVNWKAIKELEPNIDTFTFVVISP